MARTKICGRVEKSITEVAGINVGVKLSSTAFSVTTTDVTFRLSVIYEWKSNLINRTVALFGIHRWSQVNVNAIVDKEHHSEVLITI